jgi:hypothetical protein
MPYIEIKTRARIDKGMAEFIIQKRTITAVITMGVISENAKKLFDEANIAWAENIPENVFVDLESLEI